MMCTQNTTNSSGEIETANWSGTGGLIATAHANAGSYVASWYYFDQRGDTRAIADNGGQTTWSANYSEYGEIESSSGGSPQYGFVGAYGRISNPATGLIHMGARMYSANIGRFLSRDPVVGGSANDYEYTGGDPINRLDVSGTHHICSVYPNPGCRTSPEVDALTCAQGVAAGVRKVIMAACHSSNGTDMGYSKNSNGTYTIINVRTGQIVARDLGRSDVIRRLASGNTVEYSQVGMRIVEAIPFWGVYVSAKNCSSGWGCAIINAGGAALSVLSLFPGGGLTWAAVFVMPTVDMSGQISGGATAW